MVLRKKAVGTKEEINNQLVKIFTEK